MDLDFGYGAVDNGNNVNTANENNDESNTTNLNNGSIENNPNGVPADNVNKQTDSEQHEEQKPENKQEQQTEQDIVLEVGSSLEIGDEKYTVDDKGNVLDANGNIYKEAKDVKEWIKSFDKVDETDDSNTISIDAIQDAIGVEITDDNENVIKFDNSADGIKNYVNAVIESAKEETTTAAINGLFQKYPILPDVINYYVANGNSLEGFGQLPDRSGITIDDSNEAQQEAIIKTAWEERGQKGDVNNYIQYLKTSGTLLATAKEELQALQESDEQYRDNLAKQAQEQEEEQAKQEQEYWEDIYNVIQSKKIAGYQIPESIIVNRNGQKIACTPKDFFNYIYLVDNEGKSAYQRDLEAETPETLRDDNILRAYLKFVGGNYSNLVDMAINEKQVTKLKLRAKENKQSTIRISKPNTTNKQNKDIDLGYS